MIRSSVLILVTVLLTSMRAFAQKEYEFYMGLLPDDGMYDDVPEKPILLTRDLKTLPNRVSLLPYCPPVLSQGRYGTCTGWAAAYAARTITEAVANNWTDHDKIKNEAFSPIFIYMMAKSGVDSMCKIGTYLHKTIDVMKKYGVPKFHDYDYMCASYASKEVLAQAAKYRIDDYFKLFHLNEKDSVVKVSRVKKSISEKKPVVIAMWLPESFMKSTGKWSKSTVDVKIHGYHAMCVVGYDDDVMGGSFLLMNSWGYKWGNNGFTYVSYQDFAKYVDQAFEIYINPSSNRRNDKTLSNLGGFIDLQLANGCRLTPLLEPSRGVYQVKEDLVSGSRYRMYISNNEPAYVYVLATDELGSTSVLFPPDKHVSAAFTYRNSHMALPGENYYIELDDTRGTDQLCVVYSLKPIDVNLLEHAIRGTHGKEFREKVRKYLDTSCVDIDEVRYVINRIGFNARTKASAVPVFIEFNHI